MRLFDGPDLLAEEAGEDEREPVHYADQPDIDDEEDERR
jgi:hypothetical protein